MKFLYFLNEKNGESTVTYYGLNISWRQSKAISSRKGAIINVSAVEITVGKEEMC